MKKTIFLWVFLMCIIGTQAQQSLPTKYGLYKIKNQQVDDRYIGGTGTGNDAVKYESATTNADYQVFFVAGDNTDGWILRQVKTGNYITHNNDYTGSYAVATGTNRQLFKFDNATAADYIIILKKTDGGNFNSNGIGADSDNAGSTLYFNKGTGARNKWVFEAVTNPTTEQEATRAAWQAEFLTGKINAFNALLATVAGATIPTGSDFGFDVSTYSSLSTAISAAQSFAANIDSATEDEIDAATSALQNAISAVGTAKKYRILITDNEGNHVRYMARKATNSTLIVPKAKDLASAPDEQLFYLHPEIGGETEAYKIQNVASGLYLDGDGEDLDKTATAANVWVAVYNKDLTTNATTAANADGKWFRVNKTTSSDAYWSHDGGAWPDAVNNMWTNKGVSGTRGSLFRLEENPNPFTALSALITVATNLASTITDANGVATYLTNAANTAQAIVTANNESAVAQGLLDLQTAIDLVNAFKTAIAAANNAYNNSVEGTSVGQTPAAARTALQTAISNAQGAGSTAESITAAINDLNTAVTTFNSAKILPQAGKKYTLLNSYGKYLTLKADKSGVLVAEYVEGDAPDPTQVFLFTDAGNGNFNIYNAEVPGYIYSDGWLPKFRELSDGSNSEKMKILPADGTYFTIQALNRNADQYFAIDGNATATTMTFDKGKQWGLWTFTEVESAANVTITTQLPAIDATDVLPNATVSVAFSDVVTEGTSISGITIKDADNNAVTNVSGSVSSVTLTIAHDDFAYSKTYTVTIPAGAINEYSGAISWSFTTCEAPVLPVAGKSYNIVHSSGKYLTISGTTVVLADKIADDTENAQTFAFYADASNPANFNIATAKGYLANVTNYYTVDNNKAMLDGATNEEIVVTTNGSYINLRALSRGTTDFLGQNNVGETGVYFNKAQALSNWKLELSISNSILGGNTQITEDTNVEYVTVLAGKALTVASGVTLTANTLTLKSDATNGTATFVNNGSATITTAKVEQYLASTNRTASTGVWYYLSSPVTGATHTLFGVDDKLRDYTEAINSYSDPFTAETTLTAGKGYVVKLAQTNPTVIFSGTLNDGAVSIPVTRTTSAPDKSGFNLVGNPYPSYLDFDAVSSANNTKIESTIWTRTFGGSEMVFKTYNADAQVSADDQTSAHIAPLQAFWVRVQEAQADQNNLALNFTNAQRLHKQAGDGNLRAAKAETQGLVRLEVSNGTNKDQAVLVFNENAGSGFNNYDSEKISNKTAAVPEIYTLEGAEKLVINSLTAVPESEITLGFNTGAAGSFTIQATTVSNIDSDLQIILKDKIQNVDFDLTDGNAYPFTSDAANTESRFAIVFAPKTATGIQGSAAGKLQAYVNNGKLFINNGKLGDKVAVFNLTGQKLYGETLHSPFSTFNFQLNAGVYLVKVENQTVKVIVK